MSTPSPSSVLEREIGKYLKAWPGLIEHLGSPVPVYSNPSETDLLPYLSYNEFRLTQFDTDTTAGGEHSINIELWTGFESEALIKDIMGEIRTALISADRTKAVDISPYKLILLEFLQQDLVKETDGQVIRCTAQYRALTGGHLL
jgi:Protein of unknown function (DUF3168)